MLAKLPHTLILFELRYTLNIRPIRVSALIAFYHLRENSENQIVFIDSNEEFRK